MWSALYNVKCYVNEDDYGGDSWRTASVFLLFTPAPELALFPLCGISGFLFVGFVPFF